MTKPLLGKTAIVTGAARGIGRAYALRLARLGADVVVADLNMQGAARIGEELTAETVMAEVEALGSRALGVEGDLRKPETVARLFRETVGAFGGVDILVNNAGAGVYRHESPLPSQTTPEGFDFLVDVNLRSCVMCCQVAAPIMAAKGAGVIVNISSQTALEPLKGGAMAVYGAAKSAVNTYTRNLAAELGPKGIRVNAIAPGITLTARLMKLDSETGVGTSEQLEAIALRRFAMPEDMANVLEFLVGDLSAYVTGQVISVCGGAVLTPS
ncbi:SDR family NAD(P)-dependent oxidoreductase [Paracoccus sp. DMF]|uniref:SDR family NAD(P)-dependent oxidoreductase n=1 Tax=Paracoccus sp. DMF TaxID=400837 RepID=UPI0021E44C0B|nr:SDR family oxidoreductase [Paracoccus sp. DMF]MCV2448372.1 SDR family oxidoreductase [Paracoccus sp. DMF]